MLYYDRIDTSKGIDPTKSNKSKKCMICHYRLFNLGFKFQDSVYNGCHDLNGCHECCVLISVILLLSLLQMLVLVVLFIYF